MSQFALSYKKSLVKAEYNKYLKLFIAQCDGSDLDFARTTNVIVADDPFTHKLARKGKVEQIKVPWLGY